MTSYVFTHPRRLVVCLAWLALVAGRAAGYDIDDRWNITATNGSTGSQGTPITVTWGFVDDGTSIDGTEPTSPSTLLSFLDTHFGTGVGGSDLTLRPWFQIFDTAFGRLGQVSGVTYAYEPNDTGQAIDSSTFPTGLLNVRPDIRIGGHSIDGQAGANTLAYNYYPDHGDMVIDTDNVSFFTSASNNYRSFRNVLMHETGHGLGLGHVESNNAGILMEPILSTSFDGPQLDDILALQRNYGDALEKNGGNDTSGNAFYLGSLTHGATLAVGTNGDSTTVFASQSDFVSIDDNSDTDYFSFSLSSELEVTLDLIPRGATYNVGPEGGSQSAFNAKSLSDLTLALFNTNGSSLIESANANGIGLGESITRTLNPGTYYARVTGAQDVVQLYGLNIVGYNLPSYIVWTGSQSSDWDIATTLNWDDGGPVAYNAGDHVTFDDTAATTHVNLTGDVDPSSVTVDTDGAYVFDGPGRITRGDLTKRGSGVLELANDGNSYSGATIVEAGTLLITGNAGSMIGPFTIMPGATLQLGTASTNTNVFPDSPAPVTNDGDIVVYDDETLTNIFGSGRIITDGAITYLGENDAFTGQLIANSGGRFNVNDLGGLGTPAGNTTVNSGGSLIIDFSGNFAEPFAITGDGFGGAIQVTTSSTVTLSGGIDLPAGSAKILVGGGSMLTLSAATTAPAGGTLTVNVGSGGLAAITGDLDLGVGGLSTEGVGTTVVGGAGNYAGTTVVNAGTLILTGSTGTGATTVKSGATLEGTGTVGGDLLAQAGALIRPAGSGAAGTLTLGGGYTQDPGAALAVDVLTPLSSDRLSVTTDVSLAGSLLFDVGDGFDPAIGDAITLLDFAGIRTGVFGSITGLDLGTVDGLPAALSVYYHDQLVGARVSIVGDANFDNVVDVVDLGIVASNWLLPGTWASGDFNGDGLITQADLDVVSANWQLGASPAPAVSFAAAWAEAAHAAVPEPASVALLGLGGLALLGRSRSGRGGRA